MTDRVEEIRGRLEKATPGWYFAGCGTIQDARNDEVAHPVAEDNLPLLANAPADIRYLLDEVDRLRLEVGKMRDAVDMTRAVR